MNSEQYMNSKIKLLGKRVYSPNLKDVAVLESLQSCFLPFHTFACKLVRKNYRQIYGKKI